MINLLGANIGSRATKKDSAIRRGFSAPLRYALQRFIELLRRVLRTKRRASCYRYPERSATESKGHITAQDWAMRRDFSVRFTSFRLVETKRVSF